MFRYLKYFLLSIVIAALHIFNVNLAPPPLDKTNVLFLSLLWLAMTFNKNYSFIVVVAAIMVDLCSSAFFGVTTFAMYFCFILIDWLMKTIFANRSIYIVILLSAAGILIFRLFFLTMMLAVEMVKGQHFELNKILIADLSWEALLTTLLSVILYVIMRKYISPTHIRAKKYDYKFIRK